MHSRAIATRDGWKLEAMEAEFGAAYGLRRLEQSRWRRQGPLFVDRDAALGWLSVVGLGWSEAFMAEARKAPLDPRLVLDGV